MKMFALASRNTKEIIREPVNLFFGFAFPVVLLLLLTAIQSNIPVSLFEIEHLTPGITIFGLSFITLFCATIISKDRGSEFLQRLYTTPLTALDFILSYTLPVLPIAIIQAVVCYLFSFILGLKFSVNIIFAVLLIAPVSLFFIALGLLCGSVFSDKQVGGICGALLTNLCAFLSGIWFDLELVGGVFEKIANALPFVHAVEFMRMVLIGDFALALPHLYVVLIYTFVTIVLSVLMFLYQMKKQ